MVTVILDGYNVIHAVSALARELDRSLEAARAALISLCTAYRARCGDVGRLYVVFDGRDVEDDVTREQARGVTVLFSRKPEEADERILSLIRAEGRRGRFVVVSNDNQIANNARALGAQVVSAAQFNGQTKPARAARSTPHTVVEKMPLSTRDAQRITEEYRKSLENRKRPAPSKS